MISGDKTVEENRPLTFGVWGLLCAYMLVISEGSSEQTIFCQRAVKVDLWEFAWPGQYKHHETGTRVIGPGNH